MQRYTIFFITVNAVHVSAGFFRPSSGAQKLHTTSGICRACLLLPLAWGEFQLTYASGNSKQARHTPDVVYTVLSP